MGIFFFKKMIQVSLLIVFFVFIVVNATITPQTKYITQSVDHFNFQVKHTFQQRYLLVDEFFKQHGNKSEPWGGATRPIFMYTGNEAPITAFFEISGFVLDLAKKFNALVIFAEHRYYGESLPFGKDSFEINNVGFLNVEQALFDYVKLIESLKLNNHLLKNSPVVTFGGSYGGSLSAYMRMQYPQIVDISLASSAPILLYDFQAPFFTESTAFFDGVTESFEQLSSSCTATIRHAMQLLETESDVAIKHQMNLCETIDGNTVSLWARSAFVTLMQTNYPTPDGGQPAWPATHACHAIDEAVKRGDSPLTAIGKAMSIVYNDTHQLKCFNVTAEYARCSDASGCGGPKSLSDSVKAWDYQACTEMIHPIGSDGAKSMFPTRPWSLKELSAYCEQAWGVTPSLSSRPLHTSLLQTDRIIYSSGALDPWRVGCVLPGRVKNLPKNAVTIFMEHAAHHVDLRTPSAADPASITAGRTKETALISQWLREIYLQRHL